MNTKRFEDGLVLLGALIMLLGFSSALNTAFADEAGALDAPLISEVSTTS